MKTCFIFLSGGSTFSRDSASYPWNTHLDGAGWQTHWPELANGQNKLGIQPGRGFFLLLRYAWGFSFIVGS
jgi:hypothetical protein